MLRRWLLKQPGKNTSTETYYNTLTTTAWQTLYITTTSWQTNTTTPWQTNTPSITLRQTQTPTSTIWQTNTDYPYSRQTQTPYNSSFQTNTSVPTYDSRQTQTAVQYTYQSTVCGNVTYQSCYNRQTTTTASATCQTVYYGVSGGVITGCPCVDDCPSNYSYPAGYQNCVHSGCGNPTGSIQTTFGTQRTTSYSVSSTRQTNTSTTVDTYFFGFPCPANYSVCIQVIEPGSCHNQQGCTSIENCYSDPYQQVCSGSCTLSCTANGTKQTNTAVTVQTSETYTANTSCVGEYQYICNYTCPYPCQSYVNTNTTVCGSVTYQSCYQVPVSGSYQSTYSTSWIASYQQVQTQTSVPTTKQTTTSWTAPSQTEYTRQTNTILGSTSWLTDYQTQTSSVTQTPTSSSTSWLSNTTRNTTTQTSKTTTWFTV